MPGPTHKYFMCYYYTKSSEDIAEDRIFRTDDPKEMLVALDRQYTRTYQKATIYAVFCFDEKTQSWKGFGYQEAMDHLRKIVHDDPLPLKFLYRNNRTISDPSENFECSLCGYGIDEVANCLGNEDVKICMSCANDIRNLVPDPKTAREVRSDG